MSARLSHALDTDRIDPDRHVHGFHSYPARMHWVTAARVLDAFAVPGARVLDPFMGSGTVGVEARCRGLAFSGVDLNPLSVELTHLKCDPLDAPARETLYRVAQDVAGLSEARVRERVPVRAPISADEAGWYQPHVLKEMAGLFDEISKIEHDWLRVRLMLVFSALVVKFSRQKSDTDERKVERALRKGLVTEFFLRKTHELCARLEDYHPQVSGPRPRLVEGDARALPSLFRGRFDLVVSSPPYGGTYDYVAHHARRFAWLDIDPRRFERAEIGARRRSARVDDYAAELSDVLGAIHRVTRRDAWVILLMGDAQHDGERFAADEIIESLCDDAGFEPVALASQPRPDFTGGGVPRLEHLMALRRA